MAGPASVRKCVVSSLLMEHNGGAMCPQLSYSFESLSSSVFCLWLLRQSPFFPVPVLTVDETDANLCRLRNQANVPHTLAPVLCRSHASTFRGDIHTVRHRLAELSHSQYKGEHVAGVIRLGETRKVGPLKPSGGGKCPAATCLH